MATYSIGVTDFGDELSACVFELSGCATLAPDDQSLRDMIPLAISEHVSWLDRHGQAIMLAAPISFEISERVTASESAAADGEFTFAHDRRPATSEDIRQALPLMSAARIDLQALLAEIPTAVRTWRPPPAVMRVIHEWAPEVRTINDITAHISSSDFYYRNGLTDQPAEPEPEAELIDLDLQRRRTVDRLASLAEEDMSRVFQPQRPWQDRPEEWTVCKVLRRIIEHERFHTAEIEQRLAWLRLGVPVNSRTT